MPKLVKFLEKNKMSLIVALPENSTELAQAAVAGGADALQLHINLHGLKSFEEEKENLASVLKGASVPVGLEGGKEREITEEETNQISKMGFDFFNVGIEHLAPPVLGVKGVSKILTLNSRFTLDELIEISQTKFDALDAAIIPSVGKGRPLQVGDLQQYISIILSAGIPVIVPTQLHLHPSEVAIIADAGAKGILLTKVVTGSTAQHIEEATNKFRMAIDDLGE